MTLFRSTTGEAWNGIMYDLMRDQSNSDCIPNPTYAQTQKLRESTGIPYAAMGCSPGPGITRFFFISFIVTATFVLLNLFVAVIIEGFETTDEEDNKSLSPELLKVFCTTWIQVRTPSTHMLLACFLPHSLTFLLIDAPLRRARTHTRTHKRACPRLCWFDYSPTV